MLLRIASCLVSASLMASQAVAQTEPAPAAPAPVPAQTAPQVFDDPQTRAIEKIVRDYLIANPEILLEVNDELQKRAEAKLAARRVPVLRSLYTKETPYSVGSGDVTVVEFLDYNCPYCRTAFQEIQKLLETDKSLRVVFVDFPIFQDSPPITRAALASAKQGKYFEFHQALFGLKKRVTEADALRVAAEIGLDVDKLKADMATPEIEQAMLENMKIAEELGVNGTPAFFVGGTEMLSTDSVAEAIAEVRKNGCSVCKDDRKS